MIEDYTGRSSTGITDNTTVPLQQLQYKPTPQKTLTKTVWIWQKIFSFYDHFLSMDRLIRQHYWKSWKWKRCLWHERWWRENLQFMASWHRHVVPSVCLHFTVSQRGHNEVLPAWQRSSQLEVKDRGWLLGPPCPAELENPGFLGIRQEKQWICTKLWALPWDLTAVQCNMSAWSCCLQRARELRDFTRPKRY